MCHKSTKCLLQNAKSLSTHRKNDRAARFKRTKYDNLLVKICQIPSKNSSHTKTVRKFSKRLNWKQPSCKIPNDVFFQLTPLKALKTFQIMTNMWNSIFSCQAPSKFKMPTWQPWLEVHYFCCDIFLKFLSQCYTWVKTTKRFCRMLTIFTCVCF